MIGIGLTSGASLVALAILAIQRTRSGHGLDTFRTAWLVEDDYIGVLVFLAALTVACLIGGLLRFREYREWQELQVRYGPKS